MRQVYTILTATIALMLFALPVSPLLAEGLAKANAPAVAQRALLIVAPQKFQTELAPFVEDKKKELSVESASLEDVLAKNPEADDPEKLKHFLYKAWPSGTCITCCWSAIRK